jgi:hypothetical protein
LKNAFEKTPTPSTPVMSALTISLSSLKPWRPVGGATLLDPADVAAEYTETMFCAFRCAVARRALPWIFRICGMAIAAINPITAITTSSSTIENPRDRDSVDDKRLT